VQKSQTINIWGRTERVFSSVVIRGSIDYVHVLWCGSQNLTGLNKVIGLLGCLLICADSTASHLCRDWRVTTMTKNLKQKRQKVQSKRRRTVGHARYALTNTTREMLKRISNVRTPDAIVH
jgi:hypothetical protein